MSVCWYVIERCWVITVADNTTVSVFFSFVHFTSSSMPGEPVVVNIYDMVSSFVNYDIRR